jgi:hypothetical protein
VSLEACPSTADTTGTGVPLPIMATASAPRRERIPQTLSGGKSIRRGRRGATPGGDRRSAPECAERLAVLDEHLRAGRLGTAAPDVSMTAQPTSSSSGRLNGRPVLCG